MARMSAVEAVKAVMAETNNSNASLGKLIGVANTAIWERLDKKDLKVSTMVQMLNAMGYDVVVMPNDVNMKAGWMRLK